MKPVGYLLNTERGLDGEVGLFYNYILAGNGLFVRAESEQIEATVQITWANVRGLAPAEEKVRLRFGKIPRYLLDLALIAFTGDTLREHYVAVTWEGHYNIRYPVQDRTSCHVHYDVVEGTILDIHSHGTMNAGFSHQDNADEQGLRLYGVVGRVDTMLPEMLFRVGVYGYFCPLGESAIFDV